MSAGERAGTGGKKCPHDGGAPGKIAVVDSGGLGDLFHAVGALELVEGREAPPLLHRAHFFGSAGSQ